MSFIQVTASELKNRASELQGLNSKFQSEIESLSTYQATLDTMWEGEAKDLFNSAFLKDRGNMDKFKSAIDMYIQALLVIAERYEEAEKKNISTASERRY
ncbi:MAG: WXG100 family type VII secretion target [Lachnospiraceae bacterium]|nr:WXG100 family type VII secretion target [Lachnospiraceae bacterium]